TVVRNVGEGKQKKWVTVFTAGERGHWYVSYGFTFSMMWFNQEKQYYLQPIGKDSFRVTESGDYDRMKFIPSIFFNWMFREDESRSLVPGFCAGLGFDISKPIVLVGGSLTYNQNIALVAGLVVLQIKQLELNLTPNQIITQNLNSDQLHRDVYY